MKIDRTVQRMATPTTPIEWYVAPRKGLRRKQAWREAAIVDLSMLGAGIVAPPLYDVVPGRRVAVRWQGLEARVAVRRIAPYPVKPDLEIYGCEFLDAPNPLTIALYDALLGVT